MSAFWKRISKTLDEASDIFGEASSSAAEAARSRLNARSAELDKAVKSMTDSATGLFDAIGSNLREAARTWASTPTESSPKACADPPHLPKVVSFRTKHRRSERSEFTVDVFGEDGTSCSSRTAMRAAQKKQPLQAQTASKIVQSSTQRAFQSASLGTPGRSCAFQKRAADDEAKIGHIHRIIEPYGRSYETSINDLSWFHGRAEIMHGDRTLFELDSHGYDQMGCVDYVVNSITDYWTVILAGLSMSGIVDTSDPSDDYFYDE